MGMSCFYDVCSQVCDVLMHVYKVCSKLFMGMSCFRIEEGRHVIKVSCFSVDFSFVLVP